ncbi:helix-turn-helix domain-containing protein [Virgibacillus sp. CBA3643]|uniref:helix-turn-helix domain-containing protein n=1 Tax=Virgibacillus sp. CBA3643 TaxID=2942278 RepID=UPI0035A2EE36
MSKILDEIKLNPSEEQNVTTEKARDLVKLILLQDHINQDIKRIFKDLDEADKQNLSEVIKEKFNIPDYVTVKDAAEIIGVTVQMVRKYCTENKLDAKQNMPGSGKWMIETTQLMEYPGWNKYMEKRANMRNQSLKLASFMNENLDDL